MRTILRSAAVLFVLGIPGGACGEPLVVRVYDTLGMPPGHLAAAGQVAGGIFGEAGIFVTWRECTVACADVPGRRDLLVRIVAAPPGAADGSLGYSTVDRRSGAGALATVYADRIHATARRTGVSPATLLGRVTAHEVGHLLLGSVRHTRHGLMRARWSDQELRQDDRSSWVISRDALAVLRNRHAFLR